ncbi:PREDICTED: uncharacterized protein LOC109147743 [Ipomoea nil]|uniref:uncharacterized protein LOC109147743 n=1 Tax=Ipomoea nil TaxID=35883 RepID=UPI000901A19F|nr:PREDICTED: uncharacterized protein LOC109147743 [Ipomoea nil]
MPERVADMRPIALSNVIYRVMAKMITNRMKPLMGNLISESQSAFIPGRLITDNILVAAEVGHYLNRKQCGQVGWSALKLDMSKAYDRMEWSFLQRMMCAMGFDQRWVTLIMHCVTTVRYTIMVNGVAGGQIVPTRGLRQGDPLSPYLFIICAEGLSMLLQKAQLDGVIHGCRVARGAPAVSHLFFADDSLLFFKANIEEAGVIKQCLHQYERLSGQKVNYDKSNICFSRNTQEEIKGEVAAVLGAEIRELFFPIRQRIGSWSKKLLSQAVCTSIERTMNRYWWGSGTERKIHWKAWDKLCIPKKYGGLGFKDLRAFNLAMLGKQAWRFLTNPGTLVARIYKARYYPNTSFVDATIGNCPSFCWRSIMAAHGMVCSGVRRRVGNGQKTLIWGHPWLPDNPSPLVQTRMPQELRHAHVAGLIDQQTNTWDPHILTDLFIPEDVTRILMIPVSPEYEDTWYWKGEMNGIYSVKNAYRQIKGDYVHNPSDFDKWVTMWKLKVPPKWKTFLWRAVCGILPTTDNLIMRRVEIDLLCPMCQGAHENIMHALLECDYSKLVWSMSGLPVTNIHTNSLPTWLMGIFNVLTEEQCGLAVAILYAIWSTRNKAVWDHALPRPTDTWNRAVAAMQAYRRAQPGLPARTLTAVISQATGGVPRCYVDAGFRPDTGEASYGVVLVSQHGSFVAAMNGRLAGAFSATMAEALAYKEALSWLKNRDIMEVDMLTDCMELQNMMRTSHTANYSYLGIILL